MSALSERIREVRESAGLSQRAFGKHLGLSSAAVCLFESGKRVPHPIFLEKMARMFGVDVGWLKNGNRAMIVTRRQEAVNKVWLLLDDEVEEFLQLVEEKQKARQAKESEPK